MTAGEYEKESLAGPTVVSQTQELKRHLPWPFKNSTPLNPLSKDNRVFVSDLLHKGSPPYRLKPY